MLMHVHLDRRGGISALWLGNGSEGRNLTVAAQVTKRVQQRGLGGSNHGKLLAFCAVPSAVVASWFCAGTLYELRASTNV